MSFVNEQIEMYGVESLSKVEMLAALFGGKNALAKAEKLLQKYGLHGLQSATWTDLKEDGLTEKQAQYINIVFQLSRHIAAAVPEDKNFSIKSSLDAYKVVAPFLQNLDH